MDDLSVDTSGLSSLDLTVDPTSIDLSGSSTSPDPVGGSGNAAADGVLGSATTALGFINEIGTTFGNVYSRIRAPSDTSGHAVSVPRGTRTAARNGTETALPPNTGTVLLYAALGILGLLLALKLAKSV